MSAGFLLGPAGSGKTHACLTALRSLEREGRAAVYLVPEQFTYSADRELLEDESLAGLRHVRVLSFSRLEAWLRERAGAAAPPALPPHVRGFVLRAVLAHQPAERLGPLAPLKDRPGFLEEISSFVGEVRNHGSTDVLDAVARRLPAGTAPGVRQKLEALLFTFEQYAVALRAQGREDPEERLARLPALITAAAAWFRGRSVFVDGFLSWTRRERESLVALARAGADLRITLCMDGGGAPRASEQAITRSRARLEEAFTRAGVEIAPPRLFSSGRRFTAAGIAALERGFLAERPDQVEASGVSLWKTADRQAEVALWARRIDRWLRLDATCRPREIAVILRDAEPYRRHVEEIFPRYGIPVFMDEKRGLLEHPRTRFLLGALEIPLSGWRRDPVIAWLRNPLAGAAPPAVDLLENLSLEYGHDYEAWHQAAWQIYPLPPRRRPAARNSSFDFGDESAEAEDIEEEDEEGEEDEEDEEAEDGEDTPPAGVDQRLAIIEPLRRNLLFPLRRLELAWPAEGIPGREAVERLRAFLGEVTASAPESDWDQRVARAIEELLDEAARSWEVVPLTLETFARALREGLAAVKLGVTPVMLEQVIVGDVRRSRLHGIRRAIVGGLNDGEFPRAVGDGPVLTDQDRSALEQAGAPLGPSAAQRQEEETYLFYVALTRASEELVLTYSLSGNLGESLGPSLLIGEVKRLFPGLEARIETVGLEELQTAEEAAELFLARMAAGEEPALVERFGEAAEPGWLSEDAPPCLERSVREGRGVLLHRNDPYLPPSVAEGLSPDRVVVASASRLEEFSRCPYKSFANRVLHLEPRARAEVSPLETGVLAHAALEALLKEGAPDPDHLAAIFDALSRREEFRAFLLDSASRHQLVHTRSALAQFVRLEAERLARAAYRPEAFEAEFGTHGAHPVVLPLPDGGVLELRGRIDRIDIRMEGDLPLAVVIDYKSSPKKNVKPRIEKGLDLQLVVYLHYVRQQTGARPAGGLYLPVLPRPADAAGEADAVNPLAIQAAGVIVSGEHAAFDGGVGILPPRSGRCADHDELDRLMDAGARDLVAFADSLRRGWIEARPLKDRGRLPCETCPYRPVCRFRDRSLIRKEPREGMGPAEAES